MKTISKLRALNTFLKMSDKEKIEAGWFSKPIISKKWRIGRFKFEFEMCDKNGVMGRFGGGWNWKLGFQSSWGKSVGTIIFFLLVASLRIDYIRTENCT
jgi:hypothetical protein